MSYSATSHLDMIDIGKGKRISVQTLKGLLPTVEVALFFAKVYALDYRQLSRLLGEVFNTTVIEALTRGDHSTSLQSYIVDTVPSDVVRAANVQYVTTPAPGEVLPEMWADLEVTVANSIKEVAESLRSTIDRLPGKEGEMLFKSLYMMNKQRPGTIGTFGATIVHKHGGKNLVILDVSGSMRPDTIRAIVGDVVALAWKANAYLAIVSNTATIWEPGGYDAAAVLNAAEFGGTQYEQLSSILDEDWDVVITIADYDSSYGAKEHIQRNAKGSIQLVLDMSLVNRPTFLSECVGVLATEVRPMLIAARSLC